MPTAKKLPSGSWRCQVYSHKDASGKRVYKSFTCTDPSPKGKWTCEKEAVTWAENKEIYITYEILTFGQAADEYINNRRNLLSPRTIDDYERTKRLYLNSLEDIKINELKQSDVQRVINACAAKLSPKTVANVHSFISSVIRQERPDMVLRTSLPQRTKPKLNIPSDDEIKRLLEAVKGTSLELPIMLAAFGPMREGEICALRMENIQGTTVHVCENMVKKMVGGHTTWVIRHPKSLDGDRFIVFPQFVADLWKGKKDRVTDMNPNTLSKAFKAALDKHEIKHFRFHDLRHYSASVQHTLIPDAYLMQRGGWASDKILKSVYRHVMDDKTKEMNAKVNSYFERLMQHELHGLKQKTP